MGDVISMQEYVSVRFFSEDVVCGYCDLETRGRVFDGGEAVLCTQCGGPILQIAPAEFEGITVVTFYPEDD